MAPFILEAMRVGVTDLGEYHDTSETAKFQRYYWINHDECHTHIPEGGRPQVWSECFCARELATSSVRREEFVEPRGE